MDHRDDGSLHCDYLHGAVNGLGCSGFYDGDDNQDCDVFHDDVVGLDCDVHRDDDDDDDLNCSGPKDGDEFHCNYLHDDSWVFCVVCQSDDLFHGVLCSYDDRTCVGSIFGDSDGEDGVGKFETMSDSFSKNYAQKSVGTFGLHDGGKQQSGNHQYGEKISSGKFHSCCCGSICLLGSICWSWLSLGWQVGSFFHFGWLLYRLQLRFSEHLLLPER